MKTSSNCVSVPSGSLSHSRRFAGCVRPFTVRGHPAAKLHLHKPRAALEIDFSDSDTWVGIAAAVLGVGLGIGAPVFYAMRDDIDEKRLEELRALNRKTFEETGEYLSEVIYFLQVCRRLSWHLSQSSTYSSPDIFCRKRSRRSGYRDGRTEGESYTNAQALFLARYLSWPVCCVLQSGMLTGGLDLTMSSVNEQGIRR